MVWKSFLYISYGAYSFVAHVLTNYRQLLLYILTSLSSSCKDSTIILTVRGVWNLQSSDPQKSPHLAYACVYTPRVLVTFCTTLTLKLISFSGYYSYSATGNSILFKLCIMIYELCMHTYRYTHTCIAINILSNIYSLHI